MTHRYLPEWATAQEAAEWLQAETGERWPLPRLIESGLMPHVWLTPDNANSAVLSAVFDGRYEGFLAPLVFAGDTGRLCVDRTGAVSMTRSPTGELVRFTPPVPFTTDDLRFNAKDVRQLPAPASAPPAWGDDCPISPDEYLTLRAWAVEVLGDRWPATRPDPDADMECAVALEHETLTAAQLTACRLLRDAATLCHFSRGIPINGGGCIPRVSKPLTDMLMMYVIQHGAEMAAHLPDGKRAALLRLVDTLRPRVISAPAPVVHVSVADDAPISPAVSPKDSGRLKIQEEAYEEWIRWLARGGNPTVHSISEQMARWCDANNVQTKGKVKPKAGTIRNTILGAGHWTPPSHSRQQAQMHVAQVAQSQVAQVAQESAKSR